MAMEIVIPNNRPAKTGRVEAFELGRSGRRLAAIPSLTLTINTLIRAYGRRALSRSRYLTQNNPYAINARVAFISALAGCGIKPSTIDETPEVKKAIQTLWGDWGTYADADGDHDFNGLQMVGAGELFDAGEFFVLLQDAPDLENEEGVPPLQLKLLQSEMLPHDNTSAAGLVSGNRIEMGIEFNPANERVAYHFLTTAPGDYGNPNPSYSFRVRVPAAKVLHVYSKVVVGQLRGIPATIAGMVTLAMMDLYDDAELERKRVAALFAGFITNEDGDDDDSMLGDSKTAKADSPLYSMEPGALIKLQSGEKVEFAEPADVGGSYENFQYRMLLRAAAGFGVPYSAMTGDLRSVSYSSIRAGLVEFRRRIEMLQHNVMVFKFCRPVWRAFLDAATYSRLAPWTAADYKRNKAQHLRAKWLPPKWDWVDPLKDLQAEKLAVDNGFKSRGDVIEAEGYDPEEVDARILADQEREDDMGLRINRFPTGAAAGQEVAADPNVADPNADPNADPSGDPAPAPKPAPAPAKPAPKPAPKPAASGEEY